MQVEGQFGYVKKIQDVRKTRLYKTTVALVGLDKRRYARELRKVFPRVGTTAPSIAMYTNKLDSAFLWEHTPQGVSYWYKLHSKCCLARSAP